jgi:KaiC/GvpD/RAD55 family RecA-like ATPase/ketosteroid isomerase-like protein
MRVLISTSDNIVIVRLAGLFCSNIRSQLTIPSINPSFYENIQFRYQPYSESGRKIFPRTNYSSVGLALPKADTAVLKTIDNFHRAMENRDLEAVRKVVAKDKGVVWFGTGEVEYQVGWQHFLGWVEGQLKEVFREKKRVPSVRNTYVLKDSAWVAEKGTWKYVRPNGEVVETAYRYTFVLRREGREWKIMHGHASRGAPAPVYPFAYRMGFGIKSVDSVLYGGLPEGYVVCLESPPFDERDLLGKAFLTSGARQGAGTLLVSRRYSTIKEFVQQYPENSYAVLCGAETQIAPNEDPHIALARNYENLTELSLTLSKTLEGIPQNLRRQSRCRIDILSDVLIRHGAIAARKWFAELSARLKANGFTTLVVVDPLMHEEKDKAAISELFDGQIVCYESPSTKKPGRFMRVTRMIGMSYLEDEVALDKASLT